MKIIGRFEAQRIAPQHDGGVDHSATGLILVECADLKKISMFERLRLVWRKGGSHWASIGERSYHVASLEAIGGRQESNLKYWDIYPRAVFEGGRITEKRVREHLQKIQEVMKGLPITMEHIDLKRTFIITEVVG